MRHLTDSRVVEDLNGNGKWLCANARLVKDGEARPHYKARIEVTSTKLRDVPTSFRLIPGMTVTAEINAGERTILSYFLYPLLRGLDESIREP